MSTATNRTEDDGLVIRLGTIGLGLAAGWLAERVVTVAWKKVSGKDAPTDLDDPDVHLVSAVAFAAVAAGVGVLARSLAARHGKGLVRKVTSRRSA